MSQAVLVTGVSGFVGSAVARSLAESGHHVIGLDVIPPAWSTDGLPVVVGDLLDADTLDGLPGHLDSVIHCAGLFDAGASLKDLMVVNVSGTAAALALAEERRSHFVHLSSAAVYGPSFSPRTEDMPVDPRGWYALSKLYAEHLVSAARTPASVLRLSCPVGPGQRRGVLVKIAERIRAQEAVSIQPSGGPLLSLTDVREVAAVVSGLIEGSIPAGTYNVAGPAMSIRQIGELVGAHLSMEPCFVVEQEESGGWVADATRVREHGVRSLDPRPAIRQWLEEWNR